MMVAEKDIDGFLSFEVEIVRCANFGGAFVLLRNQCRGLLNLCVSDTTKPVLLNNPIFIPALLDGLLLDPDHPRKDVDEQIKVAVQRDYAECIQQISLFGPGCAALAANPDVVAVLDMLVDKAWSEEAKICAGGALKQLCPERYAKTVVINSDADRHIMMSCACHAQRPPPCHDLCFGLSIVWLVPPCADNSRVRDCVFASIRSMGCAGSH